jgi:hypothetical protein
MRTSVLVMLVGLGLLVFPEPATTLIGLVVLLAGVAMYVL